MLDILGFIVFLSKYQNNRSSGLTDYYWLKSIVCQYPLHFLNLTAFCLNYEDKLISMKSLFNTKKGILNFLAGDRQESTKDIGN